jgi:hypothetical protein
MGSEDFVTHFLDEALFQDVVHIDDIFILRNTQIASGILSSCVTNRPFYLIRTILLSFFFRVFFGEFQQYSYVGTWGHYGSRVMGIYSRPLNGASSPTTNLLYGDIGLLSMDIYAPSVFLKSWALVVVCLCSKFHIFDRPILEEYVS